jgi:hypothetical protein
VAKRRKGGNKMPKPDTFWEKVAEIKGVKFYSRKRPKKKR